jgi:predicted DNA-binding transcriptional regulator YafY
MSKRSYISRYLLILKKLRSKRYVSFREMQQYFAQQEEALRLQDDTLDLSLEIRTFQRDLEDIRKAFGIDIRYSRQQQGYYIEAQQSENMNFSRMLEAFDLFHALQLTEDLSPAIHLSQRKPKGTEHLHGLLHAIRNHKLVRFSYHKFGEGTPTQRSVAPLGLKEYRERWYLLAVDQRDGYKKHFGLDRLYDLDLTNEPFSPPEGFNLDDYYRHSFGITVPDEHEPEELILSFQPDQGDYIRSLPLHSSQEVLEESEAELRIRLYLYITEDLMMELLSFGDRVQVLQPLSLAAEMKQTHLAAGRIYP